MTDPHQARFERDGFEILRRRLPPSLLCELRDEIERFIDAYEVEEGAQVMRAEVDDRGDFETFLRSSIQVHGFLEPKSFDESGALCVPREYALNKMGHALHDHLPIFTQLARSPLTREAFNLATQEEVQIDQSMVILKPPKIGGEVKWHQDASFLHTEPAGVIGVWFALEPSHRDNGCLWMAPGAHRAPLRERYVVDWSERRGAMIQLDSTPWPQAHESIPIEVESGEVVVFHDHMPHRSAPNLSDYSRVAITLHGHRASAHWLKSNWLHRGSLAPFII